MVARNKARGTTLASLGLLGSLIATGTACGPEPVPAPMNFSGDWILSDSVTGLAQGELPPSVCRTWGRPIHLSLEIGDSFYSAQEGFGGSVSCALDGVFAEPTPLSASSRGFFLLVGADSTILFPRPGSYQEVSIRYSATTISLDRFTGTVYLPIFGRFDDGLPHGTWELNRTW